MKRVTTRVAAIAAALVLAVGAAFAADAAKEPAIGGYCPVAYVKMHKAVKGDERYSALRDGQRFLFSAPEAAKMFEAHPDQFGVAYHGWCATGVAMGKKIASNPELFTVHDGVTYLFSSTDAKKAFDDKPAMTIDKANVAWASLKK